MKKLKSVRVILVIVSFVAMLTLSLVISTLGYVNTRKMVLHNVQNELSYITNEGQLRVENWLESKKAEVELLAQNIAAGGLNPDVVNAFLEKEMNLVDDSYSSFWLSDLEGNWYSFTGGSGSIAERAYFPKVLETQKTVISNPLIGKADGNVVVVFASPVFVNGRMQAILGANIKISSMLEVVNSIKAGETGYVALYEDSGLVVADRDNPDGTLEYNPFLDDTNKLSKISGSVFSDSEAGVEKVDGVYISYKRMPDTNWIFVGQVRQAEYMPSFGDEPTEFSKPLIDSLTASAVGSLIVLFVISFLMYIFAAVISRPIKGFKIASKSIASGDLSTQVDTKSKTEFGDMQRSLKSMRDKINGIVIEIKGSSKSVLHHSNNLEEIAKALTEDAKKTSESSRAIIDSCVVNEDAARSIAEVVDNIADSIRKMEVSIEQISESASTSAEVAENGNISITEVINQMEKISESVNEAASVIKELGEASTKINGIVGTITGISTQTNLLALNASIEAARAGEAGRGFAVVADEIGKLASESSESTKEIENLLSDMVKKTSQAVSSIEQGTVEVDEGTKVVVTAGENFKEIKDQIDMLLEKITAISEDAKLIEEENNELIETTEAIKTSGENALSQANASSSFVEAQLESIAKIEGEVNSLSNMANELTQNVSLFKTQEENA